MLMNLAGICRRGRPGGRGGGGVVGSLQLLCQSAADTVAGFRRRPSISPTYCRLSGKQAGKHETKGMLNRQTATDQHGRVHRRIQAVAR